MRSQARRRSGDAAAKIPGTTAPAAASAPTAPDLPCAEDGPLANPTRFPHLALPFAIVGAAGGWLSAGLLSNPLMRMTWPGKEWVAALIAMVLAAGAGALLTRWCVGARYAYALDTPDPDARIPSDSWPRHVTAVLLAGTGTGLAVALIFETYRGPLVGALCGLCCAVAFVPVCAAVIVAARRAQRARMGSLVSDSDRRAVWGILAAALAVTTLEALPDWPAFLAGDVALPIPALLMVIAAGAVIAAVLAADLRALRVARGSVTEGLVQRDAADPEPADTTVARLDLGLGEDAWERLARSASAYRGRDRTLAVIQGSPEQALAALHRATRRGVVSLAMVGAVCAAHAAANVIPAQHFYAERRCEMGDAAACTRAAEHALPEDVERAMALYEKACEDAHPAACVALARHHEGLEAARAERPPHLPSLGRPKELLSVHYHRQACDVGVVESCRFGALAALHPSLPLRPWLIP